MTKNIKIIYLLGFLFSIPTALTSYINSSLLELHIKPSLVGLVYVFSSIIAIVSMSRLEDILKAKGLRKSAIIFSIFSFLSLLFLAFAKNSNIVLLAFIIHNVTNYLIIACLDIFIEDLSKNKNVGTFRGLYLTIINSSWVIAQLISGSIIAKNSFLGIYLFASLFMILVLIIFITNLHNFKDPQFKKVKILKTITNFWNDKRLLRVYFINFILNFFFSWMIIYTTLYLHDTMKFSWQSIGSIYAFMLLPFVLLSYPLGKLSDKLGEKKILIIGFIIWILATLSIPLITLPIAWVFAIVLFLTRVGAATVEVMSESYFFKIVKEEDADEIAFFRNTRAVSFLIAPAIATVLLLYLPSFVYLFYVLGAILLIGLLVTLRIKDVK